MCNESGILPLRILIREANSSRKSKNMVILVVVILGSCPF